MNRMLSMGNAGTLGLVLAVGAGTAMAHAQSGGMGQQQQQQQPGASSPNSMQSPENNAAMSGMTQAGGATMQDKAFLGAAAEGGLFEVKAGQLATENGGSDQVKQFGQRMVTDHTQLNDSMKPFLQKAEVPVPEKLHGKEEKAYRQLQGLHGAAFDNVYVPMMLKDHKKDLSDFKMEASSTQMPGLQPAVMHGEQVITAHLNDIEQISSGMGKTM